MMMMVFVAFSRFITPSSSKCALLFLWIPPFFSSFFLPLFELGGVQGQSGRCWLTIFLLRLASCEERFSPGVSACCCRGLGWGWGVGVGPSKCMNIKRTFFLLWLFCLPEAQTEIPPTFFSPPPVKSLTHQPDLPPSSSEGFSEKVRRRRRKTEGSH